MNQINKQTLPSSLHMCIAIHSFKPKLNNGDNREKFALRSYQKWRILLCMCGLCLYCFSSQLTLLLHSLAKARLLQNNEK